MVQKAGQGKLLAASTPYVQYQVKATAEFAQPKVGSKLSKSSSHQLIKLIGGHVRQIKFFTTSVKKGKITEQQRNATLICDVLEDQADLTCVVQ